MSSSQTVDPDIRDTRQRAQAERLLVPVAVAVFLFTVSYPANDYITASTPTDIGLGMFLVYAGIAAVTVGALFLLVLPRALRWEGSGGLAVALAILGALSAPGFWTGVPPGLAAGGALLGWAGIHASRARRLSQAAFVIGVLGVFFNVYSYVDVFV
jgi:hypothetical protein